VKEGAQCMVRHWQKVAPNYQSTRMRKFSFANSNNEHYHRYLAVKEEEDDDDPSTDDDNKEHDNEAKQDDLDPIVWDVFRHAEDERRKARSSDERINYDACGADSRRGPLHYNGKHERWSSEDWKLWYAGKWEKTKGRNMEQYGTRQLTHQTMRLNNG